MFTQLFFFNMVTTLSVNISRSTTESRRSTTLNHLWNSKSLLTMTQWSLLPAWIKYFLDRYAIVKSLKSKKFSIIYFNKSHLKFTENAFYFKENPFMALQIFTFLSWVSSFVKRQLDQKMINFKTYGVTNWTTNNCYTHIA